MNSEELAGNVVSAAINALRQTSMVPFWKSSIDVTPWKEVRELFETSRLKDGRARKLLEQVFAQLAFESFKLVAKDVRTYTDEPLTSVQVEVREGHEWYDVFREAWKGAESPNEWCLSDNAARLLRWIEGPKNTGEFTSQNRIGAQAGLKGGGSRSRIGRYLKEIAFKSPHGVSFEKRGYCDAEFKIELFVKDGAVTRRVFQNPVFEGELVHFKRASAEAYARMLEDYVLSKDCADGQPCVLFDIHSRGELIRALPDVKAHENTSPENVKDFLKRVRLARGLKVAATMSDMTEEGWRLGAVAEEGWSWDRVRESIRQARSRKDPRSAYGLSDRAARIVEWIWNLHDHEVAQGLTPCVEDAASEQMGIEGLEYEQNSGTLLEVLIDEINEKAPLRLRLLPWSSYARKHHRILVKEVDPDADLVRRIQMHGAGKGVSLSAQEVENMLSQLWGTTDAATFVRPSLSD